MIEIAVGKQSNGATFELTPKTEAMLKARFPDWTPAPDSVFVSSHRQWDFERMQDPLWAQIVMLLTKLDEQQIRELGGFTFLRPSSREVIYESHAA
jgi:hypothetical protein